MSTTPSPKPERPDLDRLRIDRSSSDAVLTQRGVPWFRLAFLALAVGAVVFFFREDLGLGGASQQPTATVRATLVVPGQARTGDVSSNGYVIANRMASLATVLSGRMVELNVGVGDSVKENDIVARIQYDDLQASLSEATKRAEALAVQIREAGLAVAAAESQVAGAKAEHAAGVAGGDNLKAEVEVRRRQLEEAQEALERDQREVARNQKLWDAQLIKENEWDAVQTAARVSQRAVDTATTRITAAAGLITAWEGRLQRLLQGIATAEKQTALQRIGVERITAEHQATLQNVELARILLEKTIIRAPFNGLVIRKDAEIGEVIAPTGAGNSRGSVVTIIDPDSLEMQVELNERRFMGIEEGRAATIFLDAEPNRGWPGSVRKVWPGADRSKGTIELRIKFTERPPYARPDMAGRVVLRKSESDSVQVEEAYVTVPSRTLVRRSGKVFVWIVDAGVLVLHEVIVGENRGTSVVVEGLDGNELLVSMPTAALREGETVNVKP